VTITPLGSTEKVSKFLMPLKSVHNQSNIFNEEKCIFGQCGKLKTVLKKYNIWQIKIFEKQNFNSSLLIISFKPYFVQPDHNLN
jgi:hypothetical protein